MTHISAECYYCYIFRLCKQQNLSHSDGRPGEGRLDAAGSSGRGSPRPRNYRLWALPAAVVLAAGILMGALFFREQHEDLVPQTQPEGEVIDDTDIVGSIDMLIPLEPES